MRTGRQNPINLFASRILHLDGYGKKWTNRRHANAVARLKFESFNKGGKKKNELYDFCFHSLCYDKNVENEIKNKNCSSRSIMDEYSLLELNNERERHFFFGLSAFLIEGI